MVLWLILIFGNIMYTGITTWELIPYGVMTELLFLSNALHPVSVYKCVKRLKKTVVTKLQCLSDNEIYPFVMFKLSVSTDNAIM